MARAKSVFASRRRDVVVGIGDDAAVVKGSGDLAVTTDVLVLGQDFRADADPRRLGRKALSVNVSDLAAMGATPLWAVLTLGLPRETPTDWFEGFLQGFRSAANDYGVAVVGGDLSATGTTFASVTALGRASAGGVLRRDGAGAGDALFVSGTLGAAAAGLALLEAGFRLGNGDVSKVTAPRGRRLAPPRATEVGRLIRHQTDPRAQVELGKALAEDGLASAAIDVSDGLARDLHHLCRASGVGAVLDAAALPIDSALFDLKGLVTLDPRSAALYGGEDFGLLFSVPKRKLTAVERLSGRFALRRIGTLNDSGQVQLSGDGQSAPLPDAGFDHFAG